MLLGDVLNDVAMSYALVRPACKKCMDETLDLLEANVGPLLMVVEDDIRMMPDVYNALINRSALHYLQLFPQMKKLRKGIDWVAYHEALENYLPHHYECTDFSEEKLLFPRSHVWWRMFDEPRERCRKCNCSHPQSWNTTGERCSRSSGSNC